MASKLFNSLGKLHYGEKATHNAFEEQIVNITFLQTRDRNIHGNLLKMKEKSPRLFVVSYVKPRSKKRKQKQIKRNAKKLKKQEEKTVKELLKSPIGPMFFHFEGKSGIFKVIT